MKLTGQPIVCVVGARPNLVKMAPILRAFGTHRLRHLLVHTGQHYDQAMDGQFFAALGLPKPDAHLEVGSGSHGRQTGLIMQRFEPFLESHPADAVLVVGDVNSSVGASLVAVKRHVPVIHVEAGLRSQDRSMPEEINRIVIDQVSDLLFTTERSAAENLAAEGIEPRRIHFVGNVMIDSLLHHLPKAPVVGSVFERNGIDVRIAAGAYGVLTLHRPSNVDDASTLSDVLETLALVAKDCPLIFPAHPRTRARLESAGLIPKLADRGLLLTAPLGYLDMLAVMRGARIVITDSGGVQEETTALGVPCVTLRENTERPVTVLEGTNVLAGNSRERILSAVAASLRGTAGRVARRPELWDGGAADRIARTLVGMRD